MTALAAKGGLFSISGRQWLILLMVQLEILRQAAMIGYLNAFYLMAFATLAAMPLAAFMRRITRDP
jgi:hypothetical protein